MQFVGNVMLPEMKISCQTSERVIAMTPRYICTNCMFSLTANKDGYSTVNSMAWGTFTAVL